MDMGPNSR